MYWVYAIKSQIDNRIYVGMTSNVDKRVAEHNSAKTRSTKAFVPWVLIYKESAESRSQARCREKYLKSGIGKEFLKSII
jgi:putative endonuclease